MTKHLRAIPVALFTLVAALLVSVAPSQLDAQSQGTEIMPEAPPIEDGELETFAEVYLDVAEVRVQMQQQLQQASGQQEQQQLQQEAQGEMRAILEESPLTIERYTQIGQILNTDPEQRAEFQAVVEELQNEEGGGGGR